jgi:inosine-uridine nucleoside N-ribohydrolase
MRHIILDTDIGTDVDGLLALVLVTKAWNYALKE